MSSPTVGKAYGITSASPRTPEGRCRHQIGLTGSYAAVRVRFILTTSCEQLRSSCLWLQLTRGSTALSRLRRYRDTLQIASHLLAVLRLLFASR